MNIPDSVAYAVVGAGVHGLSTAYHLAQARHAAGQRAGGDILVIDKKGVGAGASGIACGVIRNNYFQPAMRELMIHSVEVWEANANALSYHPVGYMQISPECMHADVATIYDQQRALGYESEFIEGEGECTRYMQNIFRDWRAKGITSVLHEKRGGYANNMASMRGLAEKATAAGVRFAHGVTVDAFDTANGVVQGLHTSAGYLKADCVIVALGPWVGIAWQKLGLPMEIRVRQNGTLHENVPMWTYWCLQEGTLAVDPKFQYTLDGQMPPVLHVDTDAPLFNESTGEAIYDGEVWGIYYKPDFGFGGVQGGSSPYRIEQPFDEVAVDPYGHESAVYTVRPDFPDMWCSALSFCQERFAGKRHLFREGASAGLGAFTPDSFPVFDQMLANVYMIADSNHGYKMIGVGKLVAQELQGQRSTLLEPFRFSRYEKGELHPVSNSPFPWS